MKNKNKFNKDAIDSSKENEDDKEENEKKKNEIWRSQLRAMNERFESQLNESVFPGIREDVVYHGLKLTNATVLYKTFTDLCFCDSTKV